MTTYWVGFILFFIFSLFLIVFGLNIIKQDKEKEKQLKQNLNKTKSH